MSRPLRIDPADGWHHVMNRGVDREAIFHADVDRLEFGRLLGSACARFGVHIHAYCLMGNHFHLLMRCPQGGVSTSMHRVCSLYARFVNDRVGRVGHLFGDRFTSRLLTTPDYIANVVRYIHRNPLDIAGVRSPSDYRWSSHRTYLGHRTAPWWLSVSPVIDWFGGPTGFDSFVTRNDLPTTPSPTPGLSADVVLSTIEVVLAETSQLTGSYVRSERRAIALEFVRVADEPLRVSLLEALGIPSLGALRTAEYRARRFAAAHPDIDRQVRRVVELLQPLRPALRRAG